MPHAVPVALVWPAVVREAAQRLAARGLECFAVGGAVRDAWWGMATHDWDLATPALPEQVAACLPMATSVDRQLGAVHVALDGGVDLTITTLRRESGYRDRRHPTEVEFVTDLATDAARRDFTINALYVGLDGRWFDPTGGLADLRSGTLRTIGDPEVRFGEDVLRLLRAVRFAASRGLALEPATAAGLRSCAPLLGELSVERAYGELTAMFVGRGAGRALRLLIETGLAAVVLPEVVPMRGVPQPPEYHPEGDVLIHVGLVLDALAPRDAVQAWSAVLHDVGKPATYQVAGDRIRFSGHDVVSAQAADDILRRLHAPREVRDVVVEICRDHIKLAGIMQMRQVRRDRWLRSPYFAAHLAFHRADCLGSHGKLDIHLAASAALRDLPPQPPTLCTGKDVLELGVPAGPAVGEVLRALDGEVEKLDSVDRPVALALLRRIVEDRYGPDSRRPM